MTRVRFLLNRNVATVVDGEPGPGEVSRAQVDTWKAAGIPLEILEDAEPAADSGNADPATSPTTPPKSRDQRRGRGGTVTSLGS